MSKVKVEDVYNPENMLMGMAVVLSWTLFLPARFLAYLAKKANKNPQKGGNE